MKINSAMMKGESYGHALRARRGLSALTALVAVWISAIVIGLLALIQYDLRPSAGGSPPEYWPTATRLTPSDSGPTLVMFLHPRCPCSKAGLTELGWILEHAGNKAFAYLIFVGPHGGPQGWERGKLWDQAATMPHVTRVVDHDREARRFGASTSGTTLIYDRDGRLVFHGGINASRGHEGANVARDAALALMVGRTGTRNTAPVFGCPLFDASCPVAEAAP